MKNEFRAITEEWTNKAESDFKFAKASFDEFGEFYSQMCLLCHDAAEKYIKGFIASYGLKPERTHDLVTLLNDCIKLPEEKTSLLALESGCRVLNRYYTPLKYPSHYPPVTRDQAKEAVEATETIKHVILNCLKLST